VFLELAEDYRDGYVIYDYVDILHSVCCLLLPGTSFLSQFTNAVMMRKKHQANHANLCTTFSPEVLTKWEKLVADWNADSRKQDPYMEPVISKCTNILPLTF
jgi:hypothetical protein